MTRRDLVSDCARCAALCCIATFFEAGSDFALSKAAGVRCTHLSVACRCAIHDDRVVRGFGGCMAYDCYGAGQRATEAFASESDPIRDEAFLALRRVHEWLWLLTNAVTLCPASSEDLRGQLAAEIQALDIVANHKATALLAIDLVSLQVRVDRALGRVGAVLGGRAGWDRRRAAEGSQDLVAARQLLRKAAGSNSR